MMGACIPPSFLEGLSMIDKPSQATGVYDVAMQGFAEKWPPLVSPEQWKLQKIRKVVDEAMAGHADNASDYGAIPCTEKEHCRWCELKNILDEK